MRHVAASLTLALALALAGCPGPNPLPIDGGRDGGRDAPGGDTPGVDVGMVDGGGTDGGGVDGGETDGGEADGGELADAPGCGNGVVDTGEDCESGMLGAATCNSEGFDGGELGCRADCTFDFSECFECGNDTIEADEICDGTDVGSASCADEGFDTGTIGCEDDCSALDTSMCRDFVCGDSMIEGDEACEGTNFGGATCVSLGHDGGSLSCASCMIVQTACSDCGDATIEGTEVCDGTNVGTRTCIDEGFAGGTLGCTSTCGAYDTSACTSLPHPTAGQVVITEFMPNPRTLSDTDSEWFEITNTSSSTVTLSGCRFEDNQPTPAVFTVGALTLAPGAYATLANGEAPGFTPTYVYSSWSLVNSEPDEIRLVCDGTTIDSVLFSNTGWPWGNGVSASLSPASTTAAANDNVANWCAGVGSYEATGPNLGTPGVANPACGVVTPPEDCDNGTDDDGDTLVDCADPGCVADPACVVSVPEVCSGGIDEDGDTFIDCADSDCVGSPSCPTPMFRGVIISEYIEGSSTFKALEIWNNTASDVDLSAYSIRVQQNGTSSVGSYVTLALSGTLASNDVMTLCTSTFPGLTCDFESTGSVVNFNGNDSVALLRDGVVIDLIGVDGVNPGTAWSGGTPTVSTANMTLRRACSVASGDPDGDSNPSVEWRGFAIDDVSGFGTGACSP